ncbi:unnamed protein product [Parascedosporium putredinis]|uniref:Basic proline-rich protein n=1 Tax=Parascedosporium putredinis TaxID=1442378 RepID=A0A9P1MCL5_9PEZI|nr:unnamed protein product [Parascedosporium putredinis]CAI7998633.1 unnamed protein product [Parascedosporium putredinis]
MEPVPETERMEEFRQSPLPTLRLQTPMTAIHGGDGDGLTRLQALRRLTDPAPSSPKSPSWYSSSNSVPYRPRTTSPLSGPFSLAKLAQPDPYPSQDSRRIISPVSPVRMTVLEPSERKVPERTSSPGGLTATPLLRSPCLATADLPHHSGTLPPAPYQHHDSRFPDAEEAAVEAERLARLKADAEAAESSDSSTESKSRSSLDVPTRGRTLSFGSRDKRKRWSVCGAERRGDLDLETIWED